MYNVASNFHQLAVQGSPRTRCRIYFIPDTVDCTDDTDVIANGTLLVRENTDTDSGRRISGDNGVEFIEFFNPEKDIEIGSCVSSQVTMTLLNIDGALTGFSFGRCKIFLDLYDASNGTWMVCPMGVYILNQPVRTDQKLVTVSGYDQMQLLDKSARAWWDSYVENQSDAVGLYDIVASMATTLGISISNRAYSDMLNVDHTGTDPQLWIFRLPIQEPNLTYRKILELICEAAGCMARFDRDGALDIRWFSNAEVIEQTTYTGQTISIADGSGIEFSSLSIPISPTQNLNGYSKPWAAGGGANKWDCEYERGNITSSGGNGTSTSYNRTKNYIPVTGGEEYRVICPTSYKRVYWYDADNTFISSNLTQNEVKTAPANAAYARMMWPKNDVADPSTTCALNYPSSVATWSPYSNICPISGLSSLSVYVSPTQNQADATTYALSFTDVLAGSIDPVLGVIKRRPVYSSYNGETLVGPWLSSLDEYSAGATPTTGAQVVDLGGTEASESITPTAIPLLSGQNYIWASNNVTITAIGGGRLVIEINTDQIGNPCLSIDISEYQVERYGKLIVKSGNRTTTITHTPSADNEYTINDNQFFYTNYFPTGATQGSPNFQYKSILDRLYDLNAYTPIQGTFVWDWSIEAGDIVKIIRNTQTYSLPIFQMRMKWRGGYVSCELMNDGNATTPMTDYTEEVQQVVYPFSFEGSPLEIDPPTAISSYVPFSPGENALIILTLQVKAIETPTSSMAIVSCNNAGELYCKTVVSSTYVTYNTSERFKLRINHTSHGTFYGVKIKF